MILCAKNEFFPPTAHFLIENMHAGFKMVCTILLEGQKHPFWPKTPLFWPFFKQFLTLDPINSVLCAKILLLHGIPGYNLHRIWWGRFLSKKKLSRAIWNCYFCLKFRYWSYIGTLNQFFHQNYPQISPNKDWPCCGPPYVTLLGIWIVKYAHSDNLKMLTSNEPN